jgi:hypothetical protein
VSPGKQINLKFAGFDTDATNFADFKPRHRVLINYKGLYFTF